MTHNRPTHLVCPSCKRPVVASSEATRAICAEHGSVVPMRSAIVNAPLPSADSPPQMAALAALHYQLA